MFGKDKNNKTYIIHKKKLKQSRQVKKLFKGNNTIKRENIVNDGQNIVENVGFSKYRYFTFLHQTLSDIYDYFWNYMQQQGKTENLNTEGAFKLYNLNATGNISNVNSAYSSMLSENKSLYIGKSVYIYEISNPTNYTIYVDIYDIIAKKDHVNMDPKPFYDYNQVYNNGQSQPPALVTNPASAAGGFPQSNIVEYPDSII